MKERVTIIGGGLTGLVISWILSDKFAVEVYEKEEELGGLMADFKIEGARLEKTYHHIFRSDKAVIELIDKLGLTKKLVWKDSSIAQYHQGTFFSFVGPVDLLRFEPLGFVDKVRLGLIYLYLNQVKDWGKLTGLTAEDWLVKWGGKRAYRVIWQPLLRGKFHNFANRVSMGWLWARIATRGKSKEKGGEKLGYLMGGFGQIVDRLAEKIKENGGKIYLGQPVTKLTNDKTIACIPSPALARIITDKNYQKHLNKIDYLGFVNIVFSTKQNLSKYYWHNVAGDQSPFVALIQHTNLIDKKNYGGFHVYYAGTYVPQEFLTKSDKEIFDKYFLYIKKLFPEFDKSKIKTKKIFRFNFAQHVVDTKYKSKIPSYITPIKNLYLANFSQIYPWDRGTNYAVAEAIKVANMIAKGK